jgi:hypothetical protein
MAGAGTLRRSGALCSCALVAAFACVRQESAPLPPLAGHRALIFIVDSQGALAAGAAPIAGDSGTIPVIIDRAKDSTLYALLYDVSLADLALSQGPLSLQKTCGREIPSAQKMFSARIAMKTLSGWTEVDPAQPPESIAGLRLATDTTLCPPLVDMMRPHLVDVRCMGANGMPIAQPLACPPSVAQVGCTVTIDTGSCFLGSVQGLAYAPAGVCFSTGDRLTNCHDVPGPKDSVIAAECTTPSGDSCAIYVYPQQTSPPFTVDTATVLPNVPLPTYTGFERPPRGYVSGVAVLEDRLVAATYDGRDEAWVDCDTTRASRVFFMDLESLAITGSATVPPCLSQIVGTPNGDGFYGAYGGTSPAIGRFDPEGRLLSHVAFVIPPHEGSDTFQASSIAIGGAPPRTVAATITPSPATQTGASFMFATDLLLQPRVFSATYHAGLRELEGYDAARFSAIDEVLKGFVLIDVDSGQPTPGPSLLGVQVENRAYLGQVVHHAASMRTLVSVSSETGGVYAFDAESRFLGRAGDFGLATDAWAMLPWPNDPTLVLVGLSGSNGTFTSSVALLDPAVPRFLPISQNIGIGPPGRMVADKKNRVWIPLPWTGQVVRITPR